MFAKLYKQLLALLVLCYTFNPALAVDKPLTIVALGDSLTAGYALAPGEGFVPQLQAALDAGGYQVRIVDAGLSGDTTAGGLSRLDWVTADKPDAVILELGANDALRGIDPALARKNLETIIQRLRHRDIEVLLAGMLAPPNMGADYATPFNAIYPELAQKYDLILYPFFLEGVAAAASMTLPDGMHPNAEGVKRIVKNILPKIEELVARLHPATDRKSR